MAQTIPAEIGWKYETIKVVDAIAAWIECHRKIIPRRTIKTEFVHPETGFALTIKSKKKPL